MGSQIECCVLHTVLPCEILLKKIFPDSKLVLSLKDGAYYKYRAIFALFVTMREKQTLARAIEIQKENWG